jgi:hypothetical protein
MCIDVLRTSAGADVTGATRIFEREIGEEEIVSRVQLFMMISEQLVEITPRI